MLFFFPKCVVVLLSFLKVFTYLEVLSSDNCMRCCSWSRNWEAVEKGGANCWENSGKFYDFLSRIPWDAQSVLQNLPWNQVKKYYIICIIICINYDIMEKPASQTSPFFLNLYWASRASQCVVLPLHSLVLVRKPTLLNCTLKAAGCSSLPSLGTEITRTAMCLSLQVALCSMRTLRLSTTRSSWTGLSASSWITSCRRSNAGSCTAWPVWGPEA